MTEEKFIKLLKNHDINLTSKQLKQFQDYLKILLTYNESINLTAITEPTEIYEKHFYDSIIPYLEFNLQGSLCDVGSGAGFPSIPLKIIAPELSVTIIEPLQKRVRFLEALKEELGIEVTIINARAEDVKELRESFDYVVARAVAKLNVLAELCIPLVKVNGYFIGLKGSNGQEEAKEASQAIKILGCKLEKTISSQLPSGAQRINLYYKKIKETPLKYPRNYGQIIKRPL